MSSHCIISFPSNSETSWCSFTFAKDRKFPYTIEHSILTHTTGQLMEEIVCYPLPQKVWITGTSYHSGFFTSTNSRRHKMNN